MEPSWWISWHPYLTRLLGGRSARLTRVTFIFGSFVE
jgi:hypothetical protein